MTLTSQVNDVSAVRTGETRASTRSADRRPQVSRERRGDAPARSTRARLRAVERALELAERSRLSAGELRILLAVRDDEVSQSALAQAFDGWPLQLRPTAARLYARGLLSWRHHPETKEAVFGITPAGRALVRPLLGASGGTARE